MDKNIYICPMHPGVAQDKPGACPKCGMDLIPAKEDKEHEKQAGMGCRCC